MSSASPLCFFHESFCLCIIRAFCFVICAHFHSVKSRGGGGYRHLAILRFSIFLCMNHFPSFAHYIPLFVHTPRLVSLKEAMNRRADKHVSSTNTITSKNFSAYKFAMTCINDEKQCANGG